MACSRDWGLSACEGKEKTPPMQQVPHSLPALLSCLPAPRRKEKKRRVFILYRVTRGSEREPSSDEEIPHGVCFTTREGEVVGKAGLFLVSIERRIKLWGKRHPSFLKSSPSRALRSLLDLLNIYRGFTHVDFPNGKAEIDVISFSVTS